LLTADEKRIACLGWSDTKVSPILSVNCFGPCNGLFNLLVKRTLRPHQSGESVFKAILAEEIEWKAFAAFPSSVRLAVVVGQPSEAGPYVVRVRVPHGVKLMPHKHPEDRVYTVISGVFYIGLGDEFVADKLEAYPPGAVIILPGNTFHFHWAKSGEYITQVSAIGPLGLEYVNSTDDPRNQGSTSVRIESS
jgi:quercetin dioxygenase-like cupin family protein